MLFDTTTSQTVGNVTSGVEYGQNARGPKTSRRRSWAEAPCQRSGLAFSESSHSRTATQRQTWRTTDRGARSRTRP